MNGQVWGAFLIRLAIVSSSKIKRSPTRTASMVAAFVMAFCASAHAQQPQTLDPRTIVQTINALQAVLALREAELKAVQEDAQKREKDWAAYSAPLWQAPAK